jgi:large subunit ribosomal protein L3
MSKGSLQYWHRRRAAKPLPRIRSQARHSQPQPAIDNIVGYKAGMASLTMIDESESPSKNMDVARACTVVEIPKQILYGIRLYSIDPATKYLKVATEVHDLAASKSLGIIKKETKQQTLEQIKAAADEYKDVTALIAADPKTTAMSKNHKDRYEARVSGKTSKEKIDFLAGLLGKEIKPEEVFKAGEIIDVLAVTKGKGWQGTIKRFGTARLVRKATGKIRHVGTLGPVTPGKVMYTVPQAGQMGYHYRTDQNKKILKIGTKETAAAITPKGGFPNYGIVRNTYLVIDGSVPGPAKRIIRLRKAIRAYQKEIKEPKITAMQL